MLELIKDIIVKFRSQLLYLFFGGVTTVINILIYAGLRLTNMPVQLSYWLAWFITVLVAYLTNRKWVFNSQAETFSDYFSEIVKFYLARFATGVIGSAMMWFGVSLLKQNDMVWNIIQNIFVILTNYILSKMVIFRAKKKFER
ncbi:teichoic acid glycosylation protein [Weissella oryzae SG25]|uniref:Teichoic acid glycosylation protein n=1 Tax=Weissella oryzae (strain DSM 25784 / JCM 18191 / LMG 30913 / SG25) TaxID=1329250 RepID=A0A069CUX4_WEIOS|nr:GtrA family protein [Weissella oryzae]GAK31197.1 teichoic acid glycosylation protein [Weissella oryzae SG25]